MKAKVASLLVVLLMITAQCMAQQTITVEAQSSDISNNLDLQAVASAFGESSDLEDFERRLNDYDSQISNLDLNNDGEVDYLRVIESAENNVHVVVIQAVLDKDVFQDVATIVVDKKNDRRTYVQVVGDPYLFGDNYIIEPVYVYTPSIFSFFWGSRYRSWYSPYYWGYYPSYYRYRHPFALDIYLSHIQMHINHNYRYYYTNRWRNEHAERIYNSIGRHDYAKRYPDRTFVRRNENIRNKNEFNSRQSLPSRPDYRNNENTRRNNNGFDNNSINRGNANGSRGNINSNRENVNTNRTRNDSPTWTGGAPQRNSNMNSGSTERNTTRTVTRSYDNTSNQGINRSESNTTTRTYSTPGVNRSESNNSYQQRPAAPQVNRSTSVQRETRVSRPEPTVNRSTSVQRETTISRPAPTVSQPSRNTENRQVQRQQTQTNNREVKAENRSSNSEKENKRR